MKDTGLMVLRRSRKKPSVGDVFALSPQEAVFLFGRVVSIDEWWGFRRLLLLYIYDVQSASPDPPGDDVLSPSRLLVPPFWTNEDPWRYGYFLTVDARPMEPENRLEVHSFRDDDYVGGPRFFDEKGNELPHGLEPVGSVAVYTLLGIGQLVRGALGLPRATAEQAAPTDAPPVTGEPDDGDETAAEGGEQAVILYLPLASGDFGSDAERAEIWDLESCLEQAATEIGGEYDGNDFGEGQAILYCYGPDADRLFSAIQPCLKGVPIGAGAYAVKQYGPADEPDTVKERVPLA